MKIMIQVSIGEYLDKVSILMVKQKRISDFEKLKFIKNELSVLKKWDQICLFNSELDELFEINSILWDINEKRKKMIELNIFDKEFIELSIQESKINDDRFLIKKKINEKSGSDFKEQKSYNWA